MTASSSLQSIEHGGNLAAASEAFGIPQYQWLDLSTGINPYPYPVGDMPLSVYEQLPYQTDDFRRAVLSYYGDHEFVAGNGSQQFIAMLPGLLKALPVLLPDLGYQEHHRYWQINGNEIQHYSALDCEKALTAIDLALEVNPTQHLVVINPNNPTGLRFSTDQLLLWAQRLTDGAVLIVDEAFVDAQPQQSLLQQALPENMIVLRSFGKFFGLAGVRLGFAFSQGGSALIEKFRQLLGPWNVNGAAQVLAQRALMDYEWQQLNRARLEELKRDACALFDPTIQLLGGEVCADHPLYSSYLLEKHLVDDLYRQFCEQGILLRKIEYSERYSLLRVGRCRFDQNERVSQALQKSKV